jgi:arylsulfatase A-like enzyme/tetratricopeptide (TPR) repeat protein
MTRRCAAAGALLLLLSCSGSSPKSATPTHAERPSILLVTLDTTRADAIGPEAVNVETPAFNALAARGRRFRQAYAAVPETLPSHLSMLSGLYPAGHGVHENARYAPATVKLLAERLKEAGYRTSAFVSSFALAKRFGTGRGFDVYDDTLANGSSERSSEATTDAAVADLSQAATGPRFIWVHYYDPHAPYAPPEPFKSKYPKSPYLGEVAAMDAQLGRLVSAFEARIKVYGGPFAIVVAADHGEGLGDHGEAQHGQLLYQATMHVPLVLVGPGVTTSIEDGPVSTRRVFFTVLDWAGLGSEHSLRGTDREVVLGEAMKPFLEYGWQPQTMAVAERYKSILAGKVETYDVRRDPGETNNLGAGAVVPAGMRKALEDYPVPSPEAARPPDTLDEEAKRRLAALGYVSASAAPIVRKDAPRPADMTALFPLIERASALFTAGDYRGAIPVLEQILAKDAYNLDAALRLATSYSSLGRNADALAAFQRAATLAPKSQDVRTYLALHYARSADWERAIPLLEQVVAESPERLTAVDALAALKVRQGQAAMAKGQTSEAITAFERARQLAPAGFKSDLELGVLYLAARRFEASREALDRALRANPEDAMALFKRAQVSVLLQEPDAPTRIARAKEKADAVTRPLIEHEKLFSRK